MIIDEQTILDEQTIIEKQTKLKDQLENTFSPLYMYVSSI